MNQISHVTRTKVIATHKVRVLSCHIFALAKGGVTFALQGSGTSGLQKSSTTAPTLIYETRIDRGWSGATNHYHLIFPGSGIDCIDGLFAYMKPSVSGITVNVVYN